MLSYNDAQEFEMNLTFANITGSWVTFGQDIYGELYIASINGGLYKIVDAALSTKNEIPIDIKYYPNPIIDFINIEADTAIHYKIYDIKGKIIKENKNFIGNKIDLSQLTKGIYFIKINNFQIEKIIKK